MMVSNSGSMYEIYQTVTYKWHILLFGLKNSNGIICLCTNINFKLSLMCTALVTVVGFQVTESDVSEAVSRKFTCVEILSGGPLSSDAEITFYTQDGSAVGEPTYSN